MRFVSLLARAVALSAVAACAASTAPLTSGNWGGADLLLTLTPTGGTAEFDCAHGAISSPLQVDGLGNFDVPGTFIQEGGPSRLGDGRPVYPARYAGRITGNVMKLTVTRTDSVVSLGTFTLERDGQARVFKCL